MPSFSTRRRIGAIAASLATAAADSATTDVATDVAEQDLTQELKELAAESLIQPGHDLAQLGTTQAGKELVIVGGDGACVFTADGRTMIDGPGGIWNVQMGYGQKAIVDAASMQMLKLPFNSPFATIAPPAAELAKRIAEVAPGDLNHVFFVTGGSDANDTALQFAYYVSNFTERPSKKIILAREKAYHGTTYPLDGECAAVPERLRCPPDFGSPFYLRCTACALGCIEEAFSFLNGRHRYMAHGVSMDSENMDSLGDGMVRCKRANLPPFPTLTRRFAINRQLREREGGGERVVFADMLICSSQPLELP